MQKVWSEKFAPNMEMFDQTQSKIIKIIRKKPEAYFNDKDLWRSYLDMLFKMRFHPAMLRKKYTKLYIR